MSHTKRFYIALLLMLAITASLSWVLTQKLVLKPLLNNLTERRASTANYVARELEYSPDPGSRAWELSQDLDVIINPIKETPNLEGLKPYPYTKRKMWLRYGPNPAVIVQFKQDRFWGIEIVHNIDIHRPLELVGLGFIVIVLLILVSVPWVSRWVLAPLSVTSRAMEKVTSGDLTVRVPEGRDPTGRMGATFNRMASKVSAMIIGQRRLMAAVSHELRTPLARSRLNIELLRDSGAEEKRLSSIESDINSMDSLIGELLESARLEEGVLALKWENLNLLELIYDALAEIDLGEREIKLEVEPDLKFQADKLRLLRVLTNLLSNINRYTPENTIVSISAKKADQVIIVFSDDGPGVPEKDLEHLMEPFYRTEQSRNKKTGGLGLGLMLVKQIIEAHEGKITVANQVPHGLVTRITLPINHI